MPQHYLAVDNVCAWPNLTQLHSGEILATIFNQPVHGAWEGDVECWASSDGKMWQYRGTPAPHEPTTNRMNVGAGLAHNGDMIVLASGWSDRPPVGEPLPADNKPTVLPLWVCRSRDNGKTWQVDADAGMHLRRENTLGPIPFGDVSCGDDQTLGASVYYCVPDKGGDRGCFFIRSTDDGRTWSDPITIAPEGHNETTLLYLGNARWLAAARTAPAGALDLFRSEDNGDTWRFDQTLSMPYQHPAHLLRLSDGRILITFGSRCEGFFGIQARLSSDEGVTWSKPVAIVNYGNVDSGYPSSVQLDDGAIVTAYYLASRPTHQRYHMSTVIWNIDACFPV